MPLYSLLSELDRKVILFTCEKHDQNEMSLPLGAMNEEYRTFIVTEGEYILWELEKRKLTEAEIVAHAWLVTSSKNVSMLLRFQKDNKIDINSLFDDEHCNGKWLLENGILKVRFVYRQHGYDINIIANNNCLIHSALQIVDNDAIELLKVVPISHAKYGKALEHKI